MYDYLRSFSAHMTTVPTLTASIYDAQSVSLGSSTATSFIQITALPPLTAPLPPVHPKLVRHPPFNAIYLAPILAALGLVMGIATVVVWLHWRDRRLKASRICDFKSGPPYMPPLGEPEDHSVPPTESQSMEQVSLFAAGTPSKVTVHGSRYHPKRGLLWPSMGKALSRQSQSKASKSSQYPHTLIIPLDGESFMVENDPFLSSPRVESSSGRSRNSLTISKPGIPVDREMVNRLAFDSMLGATATSPRVATSRNSYVAIDIDGATLNVRRISSMKYPKPYPVHGYENDNGNLTGRRRSFEDQLKGAGVMRGLCLVQENGEGAQLVGSRGENQLQDTPPMPAARSTSDVDIFTKLPERQRPQRRMSITDEYMSTPTRQRHPQLSSSPQPHHSVFPPSPPLLNSPQLNSTLFFLSPSTTSLAIAAQVLSGGRDNGSPRPSRSGSQRCSTTETSPEILLFPLPPKDKKPEGVGKKPRRHRPSPYVDDIPSTLQSLQQKTLPTISASPEVAQGEWSFDSLSPTTLAVVRMVTSNSGSCKGEC